MYTYKLKKFICSYAHAFNHEPEERFILSIAVSICNYTPTDDKNVHFFQIRSELHQINRYMPNQVRSKPAIHKTKVLGSNPVLVEKQLILRNCLVIPLSIAQLVERRTVVGNS